MSVRIAVSDPLPLYRRGIMATLADAGFEPEAPEDLLRWIEQEHRRVVFLTLQGPQDWATLAELRRVEVDLVVVAVLAEASVQAYVRAIVAGAAVAVPRDAPPATVKRVFEEAVNGTSVLPIEVVRALAIPREGEHDEPPLPAREIDWLRELGQGATVARLAELSGYSERAMFRMLRDIYARLGARNRTEALLLASQRGWL
jgi:DNA-binding NarL/FixJ family response regulator